MLFLFFISFCFSNLVVQQVNIVGRHCDRTPFTELQVPKTKTDINWLESYGEPADGRLTSLGMNQCFLVGEKMRKRYLDPSSEFFIKGIHPKYSKEDYYFRSSDYSRCTGSLNSIANGLFPIDSDASPTFKEEKKVRDSLPSGSTVVPIHTTAVSDDSLLEPIINCPAYMDSLNEYYESSEWKAYQKEREEEMRGVLRDLDFSSEQSFPLEYFQWIYDTVWSLRKHDLVNMTNEGFRSLKDITDFITLKIYSRKILMNLGAGNLIERIWNNIDNFHTFSENSTTPKFNYYLLDSSGFVSLFSNLQLNEDYPEKFSIYPDDGASFIFETLRDDFNDDIYIRLIYSPSYDSKFDDSFELKTLGEIGCDNPCRQKQMSAIINVAYSKGWCDLCGNEQTRTCMSQQIDQLSGRETILLVLNWVVFAFLMAFFSLFPALFLWGLRKRFIKVQQIKNNQL